MGRKDEQLISAIDSNIRESLTFQQQNDIYGAKKNQREIWIPYNEQKLSEAFCEFLTTTSLPLK